MKCTWWIDDLPFDEVSCPVYAVGCALPKGHTGLHHNSVEHNFTYKWDNQGNLQAFIGITIFKHLGKAYDAQLDPSRTGWWPGEDKTHPKED